VSTSNLIANLLQGDRRSLAKAITLVESTKPEHRIVARELLSQLVGLSENTLRIGVTGAPGVGKSTFIESLGLYLIRLGHRVAVLAVDPSSVISGGSILGDKTRMERLSVSEAAFIRPSPTSGTLGGVTDCTREALVLCEASGYDIVIVETVGVGQSEIAVSDLTDCTLLLLLPNAGDDLQAIKRGVLEVADIVIINKSDIDAAAAVRAAMHIEGASSRRTVVRIVSALTEDGIESAWAAADSFIKMRIATGERDIRRRKQSRGVQKAPKVHESSVHRPFRIIGVQQIAIGSEDMQRLRRLWVDLFGLEVTGHYYSESENVAEDICTIGRGIGQVEIDLMQPIDASRRPSVHAPPLNHIGLWVDDLAAAVAWLSAQGLRFDLGGIRKGASGHDICFVHPKANDDFPLGGEGVLIELVQAPPEIVQAHP
jgi:LAO/AO transport system kinase